MSMSYQEWAAQQQREWEERRAEAIAEDALDPTSDEIDDMQDDYDDMAYGGRVNYYP
jgi:hypothetical protein